ncbi:MAG: T9SS type A sorting domain-containing protein [Bacteroidetes bacterium]|nr:T9SS type A sorting domain-containing protein [Bacteroidota bacterium]
MLTIYNTPADEDYFVSRLATNGNVKFTTADCSSGPSTLQASNGSSYLWSTGATTGNITVSPTVATTYTVTVTSGSCSRSIPATVHPSYVANAGLDKDVLCPGPPNCSTIGTVLPGNPTYTWTPSTGLSCTSCAQPSTCYPTTYTLTVKYPSCPSTTDQVLTYTGVACRVANNGSDLNSEISIFPNPNHGVFTISGTSINTPLIIYDSYGRQIKKVITKDENFTIDISDQPKGLYLISDGNSLRSRIIVN